MSKEYLNASLAPEKRAKALLEEMSLEEKAAQLIRCFPFDEEYKDFDRISKRVPHGDWRSKHIGNAADGDIGRSCGVAEKSPGNCNGKQ